MPLPKLAAISFKKFRVVIAAVCSGFIACNGSETSGPSIPGEVQILAIDAKPLSGSIIDGGFVGWFGASQSSVARFAANGTMVWSKPTEHCYFYGTCVISVDASGEVYVPTWTGVVALNTAGVERWRFGMANDRIIAVGEDAIFAAGITPSQLGKPQFQTIFAIDKKTGLLLWQKMGPEFVAGQLLVDGEKNTLYSIAGGRISALDAATGNVKWQISSPQAAVCPNAAIGADGTLYTSCSGDTVNVVTAITPEGTVPWVTTLSNGSSSTVLRFASLSPVIDASGTIYVVQGISVTALTKSGGSLWHYIIPEGARFASTAPAVDASGNVYVIIQDFHTISAIFSIKNGVRSVRIADANPPHGAGFLIDSDGTLYYDAENRVISFKTAGLDPSAPWPMMGGNSGRTWARH
jgi:outer membrane protein assembly factor BamB